MTKHANTHWSVVSEAVARANALHGTPSRDPALGRRIRSRWEWSKAGLVGGVGGAILQLIDKFLGPFGWLGPMAVTLSLCAAVIIIGVQISTHRDRYEIRQLNRWNKELTKQIKELS